MRACSPNGCFSCCSTGGCVPTHRTQIQKQQKRDTEVMTNIIKAVEAEEADRVVKAKQAHENEREMIRNKNLESINELRINLENKIEDLEKTFDDVRACVRGSAFSDHLTLMLPLMHSDRAFVLGRAGAQHVRGEDRRQQQEVQGAARRLVPAMRAHLLTHLEGA